MNQLELLTEELGISKEVQELTDEIVAEFITAYNSEDKNNAFTSREINNIYHFEKLELIKKGNWFNGDILSFKLVFYLFQTNKDCDEYNQNNQSELLNNSYYNFDRKEISVTVTHIEENDSIEQSLNQQKSVLSHEIMHTLQSSKKKKGLDTNLYNKAVQGMKIYSHTDIRNAMCQLVYYSFPFEIDAQAHNLIVNLQANNPKNIDEAMKEKPYFWIKIFDCMFKDISDFKNGKEEAIINSGLKYLELTWKKFNELYSFGKKYRKRKFDRVIYFYLNNKNQTFSNNLSPKELVEEIDRFKDRCKKKLDNILYQIC